MIRAIFLFSLMFALCASLLHAAESKSAPPPAKVASQVQVKAAAQASAKPAEKIIFETLSKGVPIKATGFLYVPEGKGPFPVMVMLHGSRGIVPEQVELYRKAFMEIGAAFFVVDSFTPRGVTTTNDNQSQVSPSSDMVVDAHAALLALANDRRIDVNRAGLMGFSKGGIATFLSALQSWPEKTLKAIPPYRYKFYAMFYPGCAMQPFDMKTTGAPIYMFLGQKDEYTGTKNCIDLAIKLEVLGANLHTTVYPNAQHGWDMPGTTTYPKAEVFKDCLFEQQSDLTWKERTSRIKGMQNLSGDAYAKALSKCVKYGARAQEDVVTKEAALKELVAAIKTHLLSEKPNKAEEKTQEKIQKKKK